MDKTSVVYRVKKYFFFISIIFIILTTTHLYYSFLYSDAKEIAIKGGSITEGIIGKIPSLNPLKNKTEEDKFVNSILYRSLLKYDINTNKIVSDIARCDIKNLLHIKCVLNPNLKWSNGEDIINEDIIQTYKTLKNSKVNMKMYSLLKNIKIEETSDGISFINSQKNIQSLKIFFQPIVSHKVLNLISKKELEGNFQLSNGVYSGNYIVKNILLDENSNISTIVLVKNKEFFKNPVYIETIFFKIFPDLETFSKNKDTINIFNDKRSLLGDSFSRFNLNEYILPQYINVFTNTDRIKNNEIRKIILDEIDKNEIIKYLAEGKKNKYKVRKITDSYFSDIYINEKQTRGNLEIELKKEGFFTKAELLKKYFKLLKIEKIKFQTKISGETNLTKISGEVKIKKNEEKKSKILYKKVKIQNIKSKVITSPNWVDKYNFVKKSDYSLRGVTEKNTTKVFINDYQLKGFKPYSKYFVYRISKKNGNFKDGENNYKIYFEINGKKKFIDEVNFFHSNSQMILKQKEDELLNKEIEVKIETKDEIKQELNTNNIKKIVNKNEKKLNSGSLNKLNSDELGKIVKKIEKIKLLDNKYFYNSNLNKYSLELYYTVGKGYYKKTAKYIKDKLEKKGIFVEIRELSLFDLDKLLMAGKDNYDLLLVGINLGYFTFDISQYYHPRVQSPKTKDWISNPYNLSNYKGTDIGSRLEELREKFLEEDVKKQIQKKVLKIIKENSLSKTLFTPILYNLVDKNIKGYNLFDKVPEDIYRFDGLKKSYVLKNKVLNNKDKDIFNYFDFLYNTLQK